MGRFLVTIAAVAAFAGASAGPARADVLTDLGVSTEGLVTLPQGFDPLTQFDPLGIDLAIGLPSVPYTAPIDMTNKWNTPPGQPVTKKTSASSKKQSRRKSRRARARRAS